jgi:hypothetical protein
MQKEEWSKKIKDMESVINDRISELKVKLESLLNESKVKYAGQMMIKAKNGGIKWVFNKKFQIYWLYSIRLQTNG